MGRSAKIERQTEETDIELKIDIDNNKLESKIETGIGFFDHMLTLFAKHGFLSLNINAKGDLYVDSHHTIEDVGIVLGLALKEALSDKTGINRYGTAIVPMDEALTSVTLDISGRPYLVFNCTFTNERIGEMETQMIEEFLRAVAFNSGITLHINVQYGKNDHHIAESIFKAFGRALNMAVTKNEKIEGVLSTKGVI